MPRSLSPYFRPALLLCLAALSLSCANLTPYYRTLPEWIDRVYVPMAENRTFEPGLEELLTNALVTEISADGRLEVVRESQADVVVQLVIEEFRDYSAGFATDDIQSLRGLELVGRLQLFLPEDRENPIGTARDIVVLYSYNSDYRSTGVTQEPDAMEAMAERAADSFLRQLISQVEMREE